MIALIRSFDWGRLGLFLASWGTFIAAACLSVLLQIFYNRKSIRIRDVVSAVFPLDGWSRRSAFIDVVMYLVQRPARGLYVMAEPLLTLWIAAGICVALRSLGGHSGEPSFNYVTIVLCSIGVFMISDFASYASHYLRHCVPVLWELHKVHHSATFLSPATAARIHPFETLIERLSIVVAEGLALGVLRFVFAFNDAETLVLVANVRTISIMAVFEALKHSHFAMDFRVFDKVMFSPRMHQVHHSSEERHFGKNYGDKLSIWDSMFGTVCFPQRSDRWDYGLGTDEGGDYDTIRGVYLGPLGKIWRHHVVPLRERMSRQSRVQASSPHAAGERTIAAPTVGASATAGE